MTLKYIRKNIFNLQLWELVLKRFKFIKGLHHRIFPDKTLCIAVNELEMEIYALSMYVVTFTLISNLVTDYVQKRTREPGLFSFESVTKIDIKVKVTTYMDRA